MANPGPLLNILNRKMLLNDVLGFIEPCGEQDDNLGCKRLGDS